MHGNQCIHDDPTRGSFCWDRASSSDWLFGLWPGPPQRFEPTSHGTDYQHVHEDSRPPRTTVLGGQWPGWGGENNDLSIGANSGAPGGSGGWCDQGGTYRGTEGEICGGDRNWGATAVEVWYPH